MFMSFNLGVDTLLCLQVWMCTVRLVSDFSVKVLPSPSLKFSQMMQ